MHRSRASVSRHKSGTALLCALLSTGLIASAVGCSTSEPSTEAGPSSVPPTSDPGRNPGTNPDAPTSTTTSSTSTSSTSTPSTTTTTTSTTTTTAPTTTTTTVVPGQPPGLSMEQGSLAAGTAGIRTYRLQLRLKDLKFDPGEADGDFGSKTTMAIWAYQAVKGMAQDGVVTPALEAQILAGAAPAMGRPDLGPTHTEVDLARQVMLVFGNGQLELVTHVSTGSGVAYCEISEKDGQRYCGDAQTPPGNFRYQRRISGWRVSNLGRLYNPVYFNGGIAIHGAASVPARPASHGCVRIPMHIAGYFPDLVANGEPVVVI